LLLAVALFALGAYVWRVETGGLDLLQIAAMRGSKEFAEILLACGADVNAGSWVSSYRYTETVFYPPPLYFAVEKGHWDVAEVLLAHKADVNCKSYLYSPLHQEAVAGRNAGVTWLLAHNADVNGVDDYGYTALHKTTNKETAALLIADKADINAKDKKGCTPLHIAAKYGRKDVVEVLLKNKANISAKDKDGKTPLDHALENKQNVLADLLRSHGGKSGKELGEAGAKGKASEK